MSRILDQITSPADLRNLEEEEIACLASEIREYLVECLSRTGGHLASNLGVVELTIALHLALDLPNDRLIWDVGHQSYVHKMLTGRKDEIRTIRQHGGISGFPRISESEYDAFGTGHASTSISAALGMAVARDLAGEKYSVVAVIGDGAMTGGMAFEALNNAGLSKTDLIVVLNDNEMSISRNVGALSRYLSSLRLDPLVRKIKSGLESFVKSIPIVGGWGSRLARQLKRSIKGFVLPGMLFEELGFLYIGPIDGDEIKAVKRAVEDAKRAGGPVLVHVITEKGKGYAPAMRDPARFHGTGPFIVSTGQQVPEPGQTFTSHFAEAMVEAGRDSKVCAVTAAMRDGTGLSDFANAYPDRFFDVGIAEQHAVTFAAGLAKSGMKPVVAIYSTFLQRAYDQIIHDVALQNLPVVFALDRAGIVGGDGATHQGAFDISYLRSIPNMVILAPKDGHELRSMLKWCLAQEGPCAIRYPRTASPEDQRWSCSQAIDSRRAEVLATGRDCAIAAVGPMVYEALAARESLLGRGIRCSVINARFIKPIDPRIVDIAADCGAIVTVEDGVVYGGFGSALLEAMSRAGGAGIRMRSIGIPDRFIEHGPRDMILEALGMDSSGIEGAVMDCLLEKDRPLLEAIGGGSYGAGE